MAEPELPIAKQIEEPLIEIVIADSVSNEIQQRRIIYYRNARELSIMFSITSSVVIFYIIYIFCQYLI
jgi:hypothetical protein